MKNYIRNILLAVLLMNLFLYFITGSRLNKDNFLIIIPLIIIAASYSLNFVRKNLDLDLIKKRLLSPFFIYFTLAVIGSYVYTDISLYVLLLAYYLPVSVYLKLTARVSEFFALIAFAICIVFVFMQDKPTLYLCASFAYVFLGVAIFTYLKDLLFKKVND